MRHLTGGLLIVAVVVALAGCSETQFADAIGAGKSTPDEGQVRINQSLAMPPDLKLPPPTAATAEDDGQLNKVATRQPTAKPVSAAPSDVDEEATPEPTMTASTEPSTISPNTTTPAATTPAATTPAVTTPATANAAPRTIDDAYKQYGISKTYPDGKPKPQGVLNEELRQAELAAKRAANPGYGTLWNMGSVFSDD